MDEKEKAPEGFALFEEGTEVTIEDAPGNRRPGVVRTATSDAYHVNTEQGPIWCGLDQVFPRDPEPESSGDEATAAPDPEAPAPVAPAKKKGRSKAQ